MVSRVYLVGPRGSGKTTVAALLAERLGWKWADADALLEQRAGKSIRTLFAEEGESGFREREAALLGELSTWEGYVFATGGGVVLRPENRDCLRRSGVVIWLTADVDTLWRRINEDASTADRRPNLAGGGRDEVAQVVADREAYYRACSHYQVNTAARSPEELAADVAVWLAKHNPPLGGGDRIEEGEGEKV